MVAALAGIVAVVLALVVIQPFSAAPTGSDSVSSVLYFHRIVEGQTLERFLGTTPKPLLTVLYGPLQAITGDWRPIAWLAILAYGSAIGATVLLVGRLSSRYGALFVAVGLLASSQLLLDVGLAYAVTWSLLAVAAAGLFVTAATPRWSAAGIALGLGALARQEVWLLIGSALAVLAVRWLVRSWRTRTIQLPPEWPLALALLALPIAGLHDWLLTGDPLYFLSVPEIGAEGRKVASVATAVNHLQNEVGAQLLMLLLAVIGVADLIRRRRWSMLVALGALGPGIALFFVWVSARGFISLERYLAPLDLSLIVAAAFGVAAISAFLLRRSDGWRARRWVAGVALLVVAFLPLVAGPSIGPLDEDVTSLIATNRLAAENWERLLPASRRALAAEPAISGAASTPDPWSKELDHPAFLVSAGLLPRASVDLRLGLDRLGRLENFAATPDALADEGGSLLYLDVSLSRERMPVFWIQEWQTVHEGNLSLEKLAAVGHEAELLRVQQGQPAP